MRSVEKEINKIFLDIFQFHAERLSEEQKNNSLLKPDVGFQAIDLFVLYMELEKFFGITFDEADVVENRFDTYNNIVKSVKRQIEKV